MSRKKISTISIMIIMTLILSVITGCSVSIPAPPSSAATDANADTQNTASTETDNTALSDNDNTVSEDNNVVSEENADEKNEKPETPDLFKELSYWDFEFCSGAGGWSTNMTVNADGSFSGVYHDSDMGATGPGYDGGILYYCKFSGKFGSYEEKEPYRYLLTVSELNFENQPDTEEILDNVLYKYTDPYGLDDVKDGKSELEVYLSGAKTDSFNDEILSWIMQFGTYFGADWQYAKDIPEELPFPVIVNTAYDYAFYSYNNSDVNKTFLKNRAKLPGLKNSVYDIHDDGTYVIEDENESGSFKVRNYCFSVSKTYDTYNESEAFVKDMLGKIYDKEALEDVYTWSPKDMYSMDYDKAMVNGTHTDYAIWNRNSNDKKKSCQGRFMYSGGYDEKACFAYAFIIETDDGTYDDPYVCIANMYLGSLTLTGRNDSLSCAGEGSGAVRSMLAGIKAFTGNTIPVKEMLMVTSDETDLIKKYNLDPDDFYDDYQLVAVDEEFTDLKIAAPDNCPFYIQFPDDQFHKLVSAKELAEYITKYDKDDTRLMNIYLDDKDQIVFAYEQYVP